MDLISKLLKKGFKIFKKKKKLQTAIILTFGYNERYPSLR